MPDEFVDFGDKNVTRVPLHEIFTSEGAAAEAIDRKRLSNYRTFWKYYYGDHYDYSDESGESQVVVNYCKAIVNKTVNFTLFGGLSFTADKQSTPLVLPIIDEVWENNDKDRLLYEITLMGSITGDNFVAIDYDVNSKADTDEEKIILTPLDSSICFPIWDPLDKRILKEMHIVFKKPQSENRTHKNSKENNSNAQYRKVITPTKITETMDGKTNSYPNPYGFINIVHWPNIPIPGYYYGLSDIVDLIGLNQELNEKITNMSAIINYHEAPIIVIKGAKKKEIGKGMNRIWSGLPKDADVFVLHSDADLGSSLEFVKLLKKALHEVGGVPARALGGEEGGISNTSSISLHVEYQPLLEKLKLKRTNLGKGLTEINKTILRILGIVNPKLKKSIKKLQKKTDEVTYRDGGKLVTKKVRVKPLIVKPIFKDPLPKDKLATLQAVTQMLQNTIGEVPSPLISRRRAMEELGVEEIEDLMQEIDDDYKDIISKKKAILKQEQKLTNITGIVGKELTPKGAAEEVKKE